MSLAMDRALMALSLDEEDTPFEMPDLPGFSSAEENKLSLMGRLLNPDRQKMSTLIIQLPRKWQKEGRVRGIVLSRERFQFIFNSEHDLQDVLDKGVQTHNEWAIVLERWTENPPEDFLQYILLWVRISNIPVNYYTVEALTTLGDFVGKVDLVAYDPTKPITQEYVRVHVKFNVAHPLRMSKVLTFKGKSATIHFNYENIQKRCFTCHRLNHEKDLCPLEIRKRQEAAELRRSKVVSNPTVRKPVLADDDPLKGVLSEYQVGINPANGRPRIAKEVLEEMRRYLIADTGEDRVIKEYKVKKSVSVAESDPIAQKLVLQLEAPPLVTKELNKGKGLVFDYSKKDAYRSEPEKISSEGKLMAGAITAYHHSARSEPEAPRGLIQDESDGSFSSFCPNYPTGFSSGFCESGSAGIVGKKQYQRKRPPRARRTQRKLSEEERNLLLSENKREGKQEVGSKKRKCLREEEECSTTNKAPCLKAIPSEGLPNAQ